MESEQEKIQNDLFRRLSELDMFRFGEATHPGHDFRGVMGGLRPQPEIRSMNLAEIKALREIASRDEVAVALRDNDMAELGGDGLEGVITVVTRSAAAGNKEAKAFTKELRGRRGPEIAALAGQLFLLSASWAYTMKEYHGGMVLQLERRLEDNSDWKQQLVYGGLALPFHRKGYDQAKNELGKSMLAAVAMAWGCESR